jgi:HEAT repeat protein
MAFDFEKFHKFGPAAFVLKAIIAAVIADVVLLSFILLRRGYRRWYFAKRDARVIEIRRQWDAVIRGDIPFETWRNNPRDCQIVESMALDAFELAGSAESAQILKFLRASGLIAKCTFEARRYKGWRRREALVALGRTRAPEAIPVLTEGLRDRDPETRMAALRGLERMACPESAKGILNWISEAGLTLPALPVQSALLQCCAEQPQLLIPHLRHSDAAVREVLARVLGEVATPAVANDLLQFVDDDLAELRAAAARALSQSKPHLALGSLTQLAQDPVWFVRLRAIVSLGELRSQSAIPILLRGLTDSKRLVRVRAAEALLKMDSDQVAIFESVVATKDRYGIDAYLTGLDNCGAGAALKTRLMQLPTTPARNALLEMLNERMLPTALSVPQEIGSAKTAAAGV